MLHLKKRGNTWWLKLAIPRAVRGSFLSATGKPRTHVEEPLGTGDLSEASRLKQPRIAHWAIRFARSGRQLVGAASAHITTARLWRDALRAANDDSDEHRDSERTLVLDAMQEEAEKVARIEGPKKAAEWTAIATQTKSPTLCEAWDLWIEGSEFTAGTRSKYQHAFEALLAYLKVEDITPQAITPKVAREYAHWLNTEALSTRAQPMAHATKKGRLNTLSRFWTDYLEHHEYVPAGANPWRRPRVTGRRKPQDGDEGEKRPYTDAEIATLLNGPELRRRVARYPKMTLMELYALGFYTGARLDELCGRYLDEVRPIEGGYLLCIRRAKTAAGNREIPILHPTAVEVLKRRIGGRADPKLRLFEEFVPGGPDGKLSWHPQKALGRYRDKVGLGVETDFHSTRRNFISLMEKKEAFGLAVSRYVGHKPRGVTFGTYSKVSESALRKIAETIRYPAAMEARMREVLNMPPEKSLEGATAATGTR